MLLVKYESFDVVSKDDYIEELLFKYEKNVGHHQTFEKKGRTLIFEMAQMIAEADDIQEVIEQVQEMYEGLEEMAGKILKLGQNQEYVHQTLTDALNAKMKKMENSKTVLS